MLTKDFVLGIDTSNYTTSVAAIRRDDVIINDLRKPLAVKQGERGLRQSHAFFQHVGTLPAMIGEALDGKGDRFCAVSVSTKPRPLESSYMPVFKAGENCGIIVSQALNLPLFRFSHQEGHIEAVKNSSGLKLKGDFICFHLSGGTCEILKVNGADIAIIGGSKDISYGQVLDRIGVLLGLPFPCGAEIDNIALAASGGRKVLTGIRVEGLHMNLSGIETQAANIIKAGLAVQETAELIKDLLNNIYESLVKLIENAVTATNMNDVLFIGGVSSSRFLYEKINGYFKNSGINIEFGDQRLSADNAVGIALLGGKSLWR